ncbi:MAG: glycosyltransferase [Desulfobacterales bacterium]|nr:glycosyltransferase [Desulfobacterales bacterium]
MEVISLAVRPYALVPSRQPFMQNLAAGWSRPQVGPAPAGRALPPLPGIRSTGAFVPGSRSTIVAIVHQVLCRQPRRRLLNCAYGWMERSITSGRLTDLCSPAASTETLPGALVGRETPMNWSFIRPATGWGGSASERTILERSRRPGPLELLFVGNLSPVKGLDQLLESLSRLPLAMWRLTVAGSLTADRGYARRIRDLISSRGLRSQVRIARCRGRRAPARACSWPPRSSSCPSPTRASASPRSKPMAFGLPVIGSDRRGVSEFVRHARKRIPGGGPRPSRPSAAIIGQLSSRPRPTGGDGPGRACRRFSAHPTWERTMQRGCEFLEHMAGPPQRSNGRR